MRIKWIQKQTGHIEAFDMRKLTHSLASALHHADEETHNAKEIAREVRSYLEGHGKEIVEADAVRQAALYILKHNHEKNASKAYELVSLHIEPGTIHAVIKRNGQVEPFHPLKLFKSIKKSFRDAGLLGGKMAERITKDIIAEIEKEYKGTAVSHAELRRRAAAHLKKRGFRAAEKMYLLHKYI
jgi:transcriptional regulator NrdR family protein